MPDGSDDSTRSLGPDDEQPAHSLSLKSGSVRTQDRVTGYTPNQRLGDFELLREIGRGGMGVVYEARQVSLNRRVALKVLPPGLGLTGQAVRRFEREAHAAAKLHHTNIVPIYATGNDDGCHYYAMELIEGQSLSEILKDLSGSGSNPLMDETVTWLVGREQTESRLDANSKTSGNTSLSDAQSGGRRWFDAVAKLIAEVADALAYAHGRGVIHRDIKPANLILSNDGKLCVADFGLARVAQEPGMTVSGSLMGTPAYMSPEQIASGRMKLDHRTDVYSLGAVLYEMLTHQRPFPGDNREEILGGILTKDPKPPRRFNPRIPLDLETICLKALEKDPDKRYATAGEFASDLRQYLQHGLIMARRAGIVKRVWKSVRRHPVVWITVAAVVFVSVTSTLAWRAFSYGRESDAHRMVTEAKHLLSRGNLSGARQTIDVAQELNPSSREALLLSSRIHERQGHWLKAVAEALNVLATDPSNWEAMAVIVAAASKGGDPNVDVEAYLDELERIAPGNAEAYYARGWAESYGGSDRKAVELLSRALELDPGHAWALEARSDAYVDLKDTQAALLDAEMLSVALPDVPYGHAQKAHIYEDLRNFRKVKEEAEKALAIAPDEFYPYYYLASTEISLGNTKAAIANIDRAITLAPQLPVLWSYRSDYYSSVGDWDAAISDARAALELLPNSDTYRNLIQILWTAGRRDEVAPLLAEMERQAESWVSPVHRSGYWDVRRWYHKELGEFEEAAAAAIRAIELQPTMIWTHRRRAEALRLLEGEKAVVADCDRIEGLEIRDPQEYRERGLAMRDLCGRPERALANFIAAVELAPTWVDPLVDRAVLHRREKRYEAALADLDLAIELVPSWADPYCNRGRTFAAMEHFEEALADYERTVELGAEGPNLCGYYAEGLLRLGREAEALEILDSFVDKYPMDATGHMNRAWALVRLGRLEEGLDSSNRAVESAPGLPITYRERAAYRSSRPGMCALVEADMAKVEELATGPVWATYRANLMVLNFHYFCPSLSDFAEAVTLAREGVEYDSSDAFAQSVYGLALFRNERFELALNILRNALELNDHENETDLFFLAMTSSRLGNATEARSYYDRAVAQMNATFPKNPIPVLVRDEAEAVLGIEKAKDK